MSGRRVASGSGSRALGPVSKDGEEMEAQTDAQQPSPESVRAAALAEEDALLVGAPPKQEHVNRGGRVDAHGPTAAASAKTRGPSSSRNNDSSASSSGSGSGSGSSGGVQPSLLEAALRGDDFPPEGTRARDWLAAKREAERLKQLQQR